MTQDISRHTDGSINYDHYRMLAAQLRREAQDRTAHLILSAIEGALIRAAGHVADIWRHALSLRGGTLSREQ